MPVNKKINKIAAIVFLITFQFFLVTPSISQSSKPIRMGFGPGGATYVIPDDIKIETNGFSMKLISEWDQPQQTTDGKFVKSVETHYSVVCTPRLFRLNMMIPRTGSMGTGDILSAAQRTPEWKSPEPKDHVINTIADIYCKN
jgi:hypothetical protein